VKQLKQETFLNKNSTSGQLKKKLIKKKVIKKKSISQTQSNSNELYHFDSTKNTEPQQINENFTIEDPAVDSFKKILAFQSINAKNVNKIKPKLKKEWRSSNTY
jgi:hypothetical protein